MKKTALIFLLSALIIQVYSQDCPDTPEWNFDTDLECWTLTQNLEGGVVDGVLNLTITGADPFMHSQTGLDIIAEDCWEIILGMRNHTADTSGQVYFTTLSAGWSQDLSRSFEVAPNDTILREYRIDMSIVPSWTGSIQQIRMDPLAGASLGSIEIDYIIVSGPDCEKQYITFPSLGNKTIYDEPFVLEAISTSGLPVGYTISAGPALVENSLLSLTGEPGVVVVAANQPGDTAFCPAKEVNQVFFVNDTVAADTSIFYNYTDQWMVTDALGRTMSDFESTGPERKDKLVGVFYYVWQGTHGQTVRDITEILKQPEAERQWGGVGEFHWWGEPEQSYYRSEDPWVIRRDLQMLTNARVDFMFFDVTNAVTYLDVIDEVCRISEQMRSEGIPTPDICFLTNANSGSVMNKVFNQFYATGKYQDLWFFWQGKPLIMGHADDPELLPHIKDFFTIKFSWAWTNTTAEADHWQWLDTYPQDWGWSEAPDIPEQIIVSTASHPNNSLGKSYQGGKEPPVLEDYSTELTDQGLQFQEQWSRAHEVDPEVVMITQWNEWIAQRFIWENGSGIYAGRPISNGDSYFVDVFSKEFNRDIAPMKGGYTDNYYYQLLSNIRQYKGMEPPQEFSAPKSIDVDGDFMEWEDVSPVFEDPVGDVLHRNYRGYEAGSMFVNSSGRNDIVLSKVSFDDDSLYFYASAKEILTPSSDTLWMMLLLDVDRNAFTGWEGYDYIVNHDVTSPDRSALKKWNGYEWVNIGEVSYRVSGNQVELSALRNALGLTNETPEFFFKWTDNPLELSDITTFFMNGDAAPDRRFKYHFGTSVPEPSPRSPFNDHQVPGEIQFEDYDNGDAGVAYLDADLGNQGGEYRTESSVDIGRKADEGYYVGWTNNGEWLEYTVEVNAIGKFWVNILYASESGGQKAIIYIDDKVATDTIQFAATGGSESWATLDGVSIQLSAGTKILRFQILEARDDLNLDKMDISTEEVVYPGDGEGLFRSLWTAKLGGRGWFEDSICGKIDPFIDHIWDGSPGCGIEADYWNARWEGQLEPLFSETYTLYLTMDDFGKVWIDNELLIDAWKGGVQGKTFTASIDLDAGTKVPIRVDFAEAIGNAFVKLEWESPSNPREVIPTAQLSPDISTGIDKGKMIPSDCIGIYPNPAKDFLTIHVSGELSLNRIRVCDLQGRVIHDVSPGVVDRYTAHTGEWSRGIYIVEIETDYGMSIKKLILQ